MRFFDTDTLFHLSSHNSNDKCTVYPDGNVCISILHAPGDDPTMYESASERCSPVQSVEKVILSVISMLAGASSITKHSEGNLPAKC